MWLELFWSPTFVEIPVWKKITWWLWYQKQFVCTIASVCLSHAYLLNGASELGSTL